MLRCNICAGRRPAENSPRPGHAGPADFPRTLFMPTLVFDRDADTAPARSAGPAVRRRLFAALARWYRRRATYRQLMALDDRQLADIGLQRGGIDSSAILGDFEYGWTVRPAANVNHPSRAA